MTLRQYKDRLQDLCYAGYSDRELLFADTVTERLVPVKTVDHTLIEDDKILVEVDGSLDEE